MLTINKYHHLYCNKQISFTGHDQSIPSIILSLRGTEAHELAHKYMQEFKTDFATACAKVRVMYPDEISTASMKASSQSVSRTSSTRRSKVPMRRLSKTSQSVKSVRRSSLTTSVGKSKKETASVPVFADTDTLYIYTMTATNFPYYRNPDTVIQKPDIGSDMYDMLLNTGGLIDVHATDLVGEVGGGSILCLHEAEFIIATWKPLDSAVIARLEDLSNYSAYVPNGKPLKDKLFRSYHEDDHRPASMRVVKFSKYEVDNLGIRIRIDHDLGDSDLDSASDDDNDDVETNYETVPLVGLYKGLYMCLSKAIEQPSYDSFKSTMFTASQLHKSDEAIKSITAVFKGPISGATIIDGIQQPYRTIGRDKRSASEKMKYLRDEEIYHLGSGWSTTN